MKLQALLKLAFDLLLRAESPEAPKRLPVLIVDDNKDHAELLAWHVGHCGVESKIALTTEEARGFLKSTKFSVVFLDIALEHKFAGIKFKDEIKREWKGTRVTFVTGNPDLTGSFPRESRNVTILKGLGNGSLRQAVEEELELDVPVAERSRAVFVVSQGYFWLAVVFGYGLHAGWWVDAIKLLFKHFSTP